MRVTELFKFIQERHAIYIARFENNQPKPWTNDKILQRYRFCNVYRELDTVTQWIAKNWREPNSEDPNLFFAMTVARMFNWPSTLKAIGYPVPYSPTKLLRRVNCLTGKVFTGAYMIRCDCQEAGKTKTDYLVEKVFAPLWKDRRLIQAAIKENSLAALHETLLSYYGMGSFMAGQVVADMKYVKPLLKAKDWWTWAAPGPGSLRGLNRVAERSLNEPWVGKNWLETLEFLRGDINRLIVRTTSVMSKLHAQDLQNCLCEFDKYERVRLGEGRPRALYPGV